jgi:hypothetical protein
LAYAYLTEENIDKKYTEAKKYTDSLTEPFPEFARIARNKPHEGIDPNYPKTTDGTTASIIEKSPRRVIQQVPSGVVVAEENEWLGAVSEFILLKKIIPYSNEEYDFIAKSWSALEAALTFGACATYTPFLNHDGYFCPDVTNIYWDDLALQPGKKSGYSCKYIFVRSWWQEEDIDALIKKESKLSKSAKKRGESYDSTWRVDDLKQIKSQSTQKDTSGTTPSEKDRNYESSGIQLVTGFQEGVNAEFITFHPQSKRVVRVEKNLDPRGKYPIDWLYADTDGSNPLGRGIVELVGGLQNLIDSDMQMYQYNRALMLAPPIIKKGNFSKNKIKFAPNTIIDMGSADPNASIDTLKIDTTAVANYPALYGLQKSQLLNLVNSPDTSISADVGNPGFGKTPAAIKQQTATISVDDNYLRKMYEAWFEHWCETAINVYFSKRKGLEELVLDDETVEKLIVLAQEEKFDLDKLNGNTILIDYDTDTPALKFRVDASTSKMEDDNSKAEKLTSLIQTLESSPILSQVVPQDKIAAAWNAIVNSSRVENPKDLLIDLDELRQQIEEQRQAELIAQQQQQAMEEAQQAEIDSEMQPIEAQPEAQQEAQQEAQPEMQPEAPDDTDQMIADYLRQLGADDTYIQEVLDGLNAGLITEEEIIGALA